jgi:hypothetical protein
MNVGSLHTKLRIESLLALAEDPQVIRSLFSRVHIFFDSEKSSTNQGSDMKAVCVAWRHIQKAEERKGRRVFEKSANEELRVD